MRVEIKKGLIANVDTFVAKDEMAASLRARIADLKTSGLAQAAQALEQELARREGKR